jgi:hypothetical protein
MHLEKERPNKEYQFEIVYSKIRWEISHRYKKGDWRTKIFPSLVISLWKVFED